ncbi:MAG TPA: choice-of-anchor D domain-containing protein [Terriglobales bacterium]|nr:choice-of-anchor D domain-containing protein [Terriglobales bacterium]
MRSKFLGSLIFILAFAATVSLRSEAATSYSIRITPAPLTFGNTAIGNVSGKTESVDNPKGKTVILTGAHVRGTAFLLKSSPTLPYKLLPGSSVAFRVRFAPLSAGKFTGTLTVHYKYLSSGTWHSTYRSVQLDGTGTKSGFLTASPTSENFGTVQISTTKALSQTLTNSGNVALTISQITPSGTGYSISGINPPLTLSAGQNATFKVKFRPQTTGSSMGKLTISSNAANPRVSVPLSGTGASAGQLAVTPSTFNFGSVVDGTSRTKSATLSASNGSVTVSAPSISGTEFSVTGISFPYTLNAGQNVSYTLVFSPSATGSASATISWRSTASNSPVSQGVSGTGTPAPAHSVKLNWGASGSSNVIGYNVYRAARSGGPYTQINSALDTSTSDVDYAVTAGQTYYYVVTAVNASSQESGYSNQVKAVVPYP